MGIQKKTNLLLLLWMFIFLRSWGQTNMGFENELTGWTIIGKGENVSIDRQHAFEGNSCVRMGPGHSGLEQRIPTAPLSIVQYGFHVKSTQSGARVYAYIRFFDSAGRLLIEYRNDPISPSNYQETGNYTESPPNTSYSIIGVYKDSLESGYIYADGFNADLHVGEPLIKHQPGCDLDQYLQPFWKSDSIYNETILLYSSEGQPAKGRLLYTPSTILSVRNFGLDAEYFLGRDYYLQGKELIMTQHSKMPFRTDTSFDRKTDLAWYNLQSQWIVVTYLHKDKWEGPIASFKGSRMPRTMAKLASGLALRIAAFGTSITRGMNVSSFDTVPPYMPTYLDLFAYGLGKKFKDSRITLSNAGLPGAVVDWGSKYADKYINPLHPDLVILDFGMNDFWRYTPEQFIGFIQTIISKIKTANPMVEFILLSNMLFDPDYILNSDKNKDWYLANMKGYNLKLQTLEKAGVINLDMTTLSDYIYRDKKAKDCIATPLHPNDYLARWYAQRLVALFDRNK